MSHPTQVRAIHFKSLCETFILYGLRSGMNKSSRSEGVPHVRTCTGTLLGCTWADTDDDGCLLKSHYSSLSRIYITFHHGLFVTGKS